MSSEKKESDCESSTSCTIPDVTSTDTLTYQHSVSTDYDEQYGNTIWHTNSVSNQTTTETTSTLKMQSYGNQTHTASTLDSSLSPYGLRNSPGYIDFWYNSKLYQFFEHK